MDPATSPWPAKGGISISKQVRVLGPQGNAVQATYLRRARQLVKQNRASWVSDDCILLAADAGEDTTMENVIGTKSPIIATPSEIEGEAKAQGNPETTANPTTAANASASQAESGGGGNAFVSPVASMDEEALRRLAEERVERKHQLFWQGVDLALLCFVLMLMAGIYEGTARLAVGGIYGMFCVMRYLPKLMAFLRPISQGGFSKRREKRRMKALNDEYSRLKNNAR